MKFLRWNPYWLRKMAIATLTLSLVACNASETAPPPISPSNDSSSTPESPSRSPTDELETLPIDPSSTPESPDTATAMDPDATLEKSLQPLDLPSQLPIVPTTPIPLPSINNPDASATDEKSSATKQLTFGTFMSGEQPTQGSLSIVDDEGTPIIQFGDDFKTSPGSDLVVILHTSRNVMGASTPPNYALTDGEYVEIAPLKTPQGKQSYSVPAAIILDNYNSVAIWCRAFNTTFGSASLH